MALNSIPGNSQLTPQGWVADPVELENVYLDRATRALVSGDGNSFLRGPIASGAWMTVPSLFRLRVVGTGTMQMDSRDSLGNVTLATFPLTSYSGATDTIEFPYAGDNAVQVRVVTTGTISVEVI